MRTPIRLTTDTLRGATVRPIPGGTLVDVPRTDPYAGMWSVQVIRQDAKAGAYRVIIVENRYNDITVSLPPLQGQTLPYWVRLVDPAHNATVRASAGETVDGADGLTLNAQNRAAVLIPSPSGWWSWKAGI